MSKSMTEMQIRRKVYRDLLKIETQIMKAQAAIDRARDMMGPLYWFVDETWPAEAEQRRRRK